MGSVGAVDRNRNKDRSAESTGFSVALLPRLESLEEEGGEEGGKCVVDEARNVNRRLWIMGEVDPALKTM
jgi:hypothetical protein